MRRPTTVSLIAAAYALAQLPFLGGAFRVDDPNIMAIARQIVRAPLDPYGFLFNWTGRPRPAFDILANPPLAPALIAAWSRLFGWSEVALHSLTLLYAIAAIFAVAAIARRFGVNDGVACALLA